MIALAAILGFRVLSTDVLLAYLQSTEPLQRRVFIKNPALEFELDPGECFELLRPLYGLADAGDLWHKSLENHLINDLHMESSMADPSLYLHFDNGNLTGINGTYVDDLLRCGTSDFEQKSKLTYDKFETSGSEEPPITFAGLNIHC